MSETNTSIDSWDGLLTNYLKAENLKEQEETFACIAINVQGDSMDLELEREGDKPYIFTLNVTNKVFLKNNGVNIPKEVVGKKITLKKVLVTNPQTRKEVEGLRIAKIE